MKKLLCIALLTLTVSGTVRAQEWTYYWPWIKSHISSNDIVSSNAVITINWVAANSNAVLTNGVAILGTNNAVWVTNHTVYVSFRTNALPVSSMSMESGIWKYQDTTNLVLIDMPISSRAGYWEISPGWFVHTTTPTGNDPWWTTNGSGVLVTRSF